LILLDIGMYFVAPAVVIHIMKNKNHKAKAFIVNALLDIPGEEAEWLATIKTQITDMGRVII